MGQLIQAVPNHGGEYSGPNGWTGNWSDPLMWDGGVVPGVGDWVVINNWAPITTVDVDVDFGHSPSTGDENYALTIGGRGAFDGGTLVVSAGKTLRCRGDLMLGQGLMVMHAGSKLILDAATSADPASTRYVVSILAGVNAIGVPAARLEALGTDHGEGQIVISNGPAPCMPIIFDADGLRRNALNPNCGAPNFNGGHIHAEFTRFVGVGDANAWGIQSRVDGLANDYDYNTGTQGQIPQELFIQDCVFDTCGGVGNYYGLTPQASQVMRRVTSVNTPDFSEASDSTFRNGWLSFQGTTSIEERAVFPRIIEDCVFDAPLYLQAGVTDFTFSGSSLFLNMAWTPDGTADGTLDNCLFRRADAAPGSDFLWQWRFGLTQTGNFYMIDGLNAPGGLDGPNQFNPHFGFLGRGAGAGGTVNSVFWYAGLDGQGDIHSMSSPPDSGDASTNVYEISGNISLPGLAGQSSGCLVTVLGGYGSGGVVVSHNNTIAVGVGTSDQGLQEGGHHLAEGADDFTGEFSRITSNITWGTAPVVEHGGFIARNIQNLDFGPPDLVTTLDYNLGYQLDQGGRSTINGTLVDTPGYNALVLSAAPGAHDLWNVDPDFVDPTRNVITWAVANGFATSVADDAGKAAAISYAIDQMALKNLPGFDARWSYANLLKYIRAGFAPKNRALQVSHPTDLAAGFAYLGAVPVFVQGGSVRFTVIP